MIYETIADYHPSCFIQDELDARGWTITDLAHQMGGSDLGLNILALDMYFAVGQTDTNCRLGVDLCAEIGRAFDISTEYFLRLEVMWLKRVGASIDGY